MAFIRRMFWSMRNFRKKKRYTDEVLYAGWVNVPLGRKPPAS